MLVMGRKQEGIFSTSSVMPIEKESKGMAPCENTWRALWIVS